MRSSQTKAYRRTSMGSRPFRSPPLEGGGRPQHARGLGRSGPLRGSTRANRPRSVSLPTDPPYFSLETSPRSSPPGCAALRRRAWSDRLSADSPGPRRPHHRSFPSGVHRAKHRCLSSRNLVPAHAWPCLADAIDGDQLPRHGGSNGVLGARPGVATRRLANRKATRAGNEQSRFGVHMKGWREV